MPDTENILVSNAYTGQQAASGERATDTTRWAIFPRPAQAGPKLASPTLPDFRDWRDPRVGWGVVLLDGAPVPEPIEELIIARKGTRDRAPVFHYLPGSRHRLEFLTNLRAQKDVAIAGAPTGVADDSIPFYLLICGAPAEIPWDLQYVLNARCAVGRLALDGVALQRYVRHLIDGWKENNGAANERVVWAVDDQTTEITRLMASAIARPIAEKFATDAQIGSKVKFIDGVPATCGNLRSALLAQRPALVVSTSHGMTGPLNDSTRMAADLGLLVDSEGELLRPSELLSDWQPAGVIWYAHACCSAGSDNRTNFQGLIKEGSQLDLVLKGVAALGSRIAPFPQALLSAEEPARAFIGHVEPTFDWTIRNKHTGQHLTDALQHAIYDRMHQVQPEPVGLAFRKVFQGAGTLWATHAGLRRDFDSGKDVVDQLVACDLTARDLITTVIIGDPLVALPQMI